LNSKIRFCCTGKIRNSIIVRPDAGSNSGENESLNSIGTLQRQSVFQF
jgi:hypothetical protein